MLPSMALSARVQMADQWTTSGFRKHEVVLSNFSGIIRIWTRSWKQDFRAMSMTEVIRTTILMELDLGFVLLVKIFPLCGPFWSQKND